jgi:hypothetical protein
MITWTNLRQLLDYDPGTGWFTWLVNRGAAKKGARAGHRRADGYRLIGVDGVLYLEHRLAFVYMTGREPDGEVDHANRDPADNRWCNLREATSSNNKANKSRPSNNTSGHKGVSWSKAVGKWHAYGSPGGGKRPHLGYFDGLEDAAAVAAAWRAEHHGHFACV